MEGKWLTTFRYLPDGNSKFGAVEIQTDEHGDQSLLHYRLFVDGEETWAHTMTSPPVASSGLFDGTFT
jgi:alkaline phosphatase D